MAKFQIVSNRPVKHHSISMVAILAIGYASYVISYTLAERWIYRQSPVWPTKHITITEFDTY